MVNSSCAIRYGSEPVTFLSSFFFFFSYSQCCQLLMLSWHTILQESPALTDLFTFLKIFVCVCVHYFYFETTESRLLF